MATLLNLEQNKAPVDMHRKTDIMAVGSADPLFAHPNDASPLFNEIPVHSAVPTADPLGQKKVLN